MITTDKRTQRGRLLQRNSLLGASLFAFAAIVFVPLFSSRGFPDSSTSNRFFFALVLRNSDSVNTETMKIYDFPLAFYPPRATLAAAEKHIKYDRITLNLFTADNMKPEFLKISSTGTVPVIIDGDTTLTSSRQIVEYLDQKDGKPLGSPSVDREAVKHWMDKVDRWDGNLFAFASAPPPVKGILDSASWYKEKVIKGNSAKHPELKDVYDGRLAAMKKSKEEAEDAEAVKGNKEILTKLLQEAEEQLSKSPFLAGPEYSTADTLFTPVLYRLHDLGKQGEFLTDKPKVQEYYERIKQRPSFQEAYGPAGNVITKLSLVGGGLARIFFAKVTGI